MKNQKLSVVYKEDLMEALGCCPSTALLLMKRSGNAFKIGKRWAINTGVFIKILQGAQQNQMEVR